ncbi:hypothetical protein Poly24_13970 [Rosistilla carotiformis]|uniref:SMI1 / KNR4 family protein n=1 Tax=Rosistilla carotiformis TaxID=2528017 RepID=A0A518JQ75_9BACT|nr:hypothetical protein Poly24_13970 [Rosistilla carotiformis]
MIDCLDETVQPLDVAALNRLLTDTGSGLRFDDDFLSAIPRIHGASPVNQYFTDKAGAVRRIGWFVSFYDFDSDLPAPRQVDCMYGDNDTRVIDRSLQYLVRWGDMSIYGPFDDKRAFYPFAALYRDPKNDHSAPFSLCWHHGDGNDSLCFDTSTSPCSVVYCNFDNAQDAFCRWEYDDEQYDFGHLVHVADSFSDFATMLHKTYAEASA